MDMTDPILAHPKPEPRVVTKKRREKKDDQAERACRLAVQKRDKGHCVVPGCKDRGVHMHHVIYRSQSKRLRWATSNNCLLCLDHHQLEHAGAIQISGNADDELFITGNIDALKFRL